jgi:hypothetical protein
VPKAATAGAIRRALVAQGVVFLPDDGVRVGPVPSKRRRIMPRSSARLATTPAA